MSRSDRREPLWASALADQPAPEHDDVIVRVLEEPDDDPAPREPRPRRPRTPAAAALAAAGLVMLALAVAGGRSLTIADVPSYWGDVPMTCDTARLEQDPPIELFRCRAVGGEPLPPGLYRSPQSEWTSDITRRPARESRIRIAPDGAVTGWATY